MMTKHICAVCENEFEDYGSKERMYCSESCYHRSREKKIEFRCGNPECNKLIVRPHYMLRSKDHFCSRECWYKSAKLKQLGSEVREKAIVKKIQNDPIIPVESESVIIVQGKIDKGIFKGLLETKTQYACPKCGGKMIRGNNSILYCTYNDFSCKLSEYENIMWI
jgi:hypothetical protein